jgi:hypothetical protein
MPTLREFRRLACMALLRRRKFVMRSVSCSRRRLAVSLARTVLVVVVFALVRPWILGDQ